MHKHLKCFHKTFIFFIYSKVNAGSVCMYVHVCTFVCLNMDAYVMVCHVEATGISQLYTMFHIGSF